MAKTRSVDKFSPVKPRSKKASHHGDRKVRFDLPVFLGCPAKRQERGKKDAIYTRVKQI